MKTVTNNALVKATQTPEKAMPTLDQEMRALSKDYGEKRFVLKEALLKERLSTFLQPNEFVPGQIVVWKDDMRNRRNPEYGQPAIVVEVLEEPLMDYPDERNSAGTIFFNEPLDLGIGILDNDGDWYVLYVDSRRFRPK